MLPHSVFRNYDIRGDAGAELTPAVAYAIALAYAVYAKPKKVVVGADCRLTSPAIKAEVVRAMLESGIDVVDIGMVSTDVIYFATWFYKFDGGLMITASHMPKQFNGIKFLRLNELGVLVPIGRGLGMEELEEVANSGQKLTPTAPGTFEQKDVWNDFVTFSNSFAHIENIKALKVVMDTGNGMGGLGAEKIFEPLPLKITKLFFTPDGNFPNHPANPIEEENRRDLVAEVKKVGADIGIAWDADCDRVYFIDENGEFVNGDFVTALLAKYFLQKKPGASIVYDLRSSWAVKDTVEKYGGVAYEERVGHTYIKHTMNETKSVFGGEISGHYYFIDNAYMENGFAPALIILEMMSRENKKLSELIKDLGDYHVSGEINFKVADVREVIERLEKMYANAIKISHLDGVSFEYDSWKCNVRPSANDPVLRLNLEAKTRTEMEEKLKEITALITA